MKKNYFLLFLLSFLFLMTDAHAQIVRYVKEGATGNGSSWANASGDLQEMINASSDNDQVWVAKGIYKPNRRPDNIESIAPSNDRFNSFLLKTNVSVYGGFAGTEDEIADRDIPANETILSGNIGDQNTNIDNTFHVVTIVNYMGPRTFFDGFIVEDGYTEAVTGSANTIRVNDQNVPSTRSPGIIMYFVDHMELRNLIIRNNTNASSDQNAGAIYMFSGAGGNLRNVKFINNKTMGGSGGAMYTYGLSNIPAVVNFYNVEFIGNEAITGYGGGLYGGQYSYLKFDNCLFQENKATRLYALNTTTQEWEYSRGQGAGFYLGSSTSTFEFNNTDFIGNAAEGNGGGIHAPNSGRININGGIFRNNSALNGGGIGGGASGVVINVKRATFDANSTPGIGGGIYLTSGTHTIDGAIFKNNTSVGSASAIYLATNAIATTKIINSTFESNVCSNATGGAVYVSNTSAEIISCKFIRNRSVLSGGALALTGTGTKATIINTLFFENESQTTGGGGGAIYLFSNTSVDLYNSSLISNRNPNSTFGGGIYAANTNNVVRMFNTLLYGNRASTATTTLVRHDIYLSTSASVVSKNSLTEYYGTNGVDGNIVGQNPLFLSTVPSDANFLEVANTSPIIDKGVIGDIPSSYLPLNFDALGRSRIQNGKIDIGAVEYKGAISQPTFFTINENLEVGKKLGDNNLPSVISNVPIHVIQGNIKWKIISGNEAGAFAIDETSGEISVANSTPLNFEVTKQFVLTVRIEDDFSTMLGGPNYQQLTVTVNINNVDEIPERPIVENVVHGNVVTTYRPRLRGIAEPNSIITIYVDGKPYPDATNPYNATADESGAWSFRFPEELTPGYRKFTVTSKPRRDAAESAQSPFIEVNLKLYGGGTAGLKATNVLTPNGDGKNDVWTIENLSVMYPKHEIMVYDKVGKIVFRWSSVNQGPYDSDNLSGRAWDGTHNGNVLPAGTYYYDIRVANDTKTGLDRIKGTITIIRGR